MTSNGYEPRQPYEHVVVPLDGSAESERAIVLGKQLADACGAQLHVFHAQAQGDPKDPDFHAQGRQLADRVGATFEVRTMGADDLPPGEIIDRYLQQLGNATAVMATHGRGRIVTALVGSVTARVIAGGHAVVALGPNVAVDSGPITRVLACVDASSFSEQVVAEAAGWAKALGAALWMIEVVKPEAARIAAGMGGAAAESSYVHRLAAEVKATGLALEWEVLHDDHPGAAIASYAATTPGTMVALATHGRSGLRRALVGSVAGDVMKQASVPVIVLQPSG